MHPPSMEQTLLETLPLAYRLALSYAPRQLRGEALGLLALDARLAGIVRTGGEPIIAQMKLAWWRDRFDEPKENWPLGEPLLAILRQGRVEGQSFRPLVDGWEGLLAEQFGAEQIDQFAMGRAIGWSGLASAANADAESVQLAARQAALADLVVHLADEGEKAGAREGLGAISAETPRLGRSVRPLAVLRALTLRAADRGSSELLDGPGAMALALRVGITGR